MNNTEIKHFVMVINEKEFPVVVQAYQPATDGELFVAEQMVRNQTEVDAFSSRYAGYVIEARVIKEKPEYEKFFELWKEADPDMPALVAARAEFDAFA